jgi:uncharacterized protein (DUF1778 family)
MLQAIFPHDFFQRNGFFSAGLEAFQCGEVEGLGAIMTPFCCLFFVLMIAFVLCRKKEVPMPAKTERITTRVPDNIHGLLRRAASLSGATINQFVVQAAVERAKQVVEDENIIRLSNESSQLFFETLETPPAPNDKLLAAARAHRERLNAED